jgi:putative FmdB family regulatory protein
MPTYEYACKSCGEHLEIVQSFKDDPISECPACGGQLRKVFGNIGIAFKGSGFYRTDSRSDGRKAKVGSANGSSGGSEAHKDADGSKSDASVGSASGSGSSGSGPTGSGSSSGGSSSSGSSGSSSSVAAAS